MKGLWVGGGRMIDGWIDGVRMTSQKRVVLILCTVSADISMLYKLNIKSVEC